MSTTTMETTAAPLVSLDRNLPVSGIDYRADRAYRLIGEPGYLDFLTAGQIRSNQDRGKYQVTYFTVGLASSRYRRRRDRYDYVAEVPVDLMARAGGGAPQAGDYVRAVRPLNPDDVTMYRIDNRTGEVRIVHPFPTI